MNECPDLPRPPLAVVELDAPLPVFLSQLACAAEADAALERDPNIRSAVEVDVRIEASMRAHRRHGSTRPRGES